MASVTIQRPTDKEYASFYAAYVSMVPEGDLLRLLEQQGRDTVALLRPIGEEKSKYRYEPGKWSIREVVSHIADSERVFTYRALRFARCDATPLPGYDEKAWGANSNAHQRPLSDHLADLEALRASTLSLLSGFTADEFGRSGVANGQPVTVRALAYVVAGHERHHVKILKERYLTP